MGFFDILNSVDDNERDNELEERMEEAGLEEWEKEEVRHSWFDLMKTSYPQEEDEQNPVYTIISSDEWFEWIDREKSNDRKYALGLIRNLTFDCANTPTLKYIVSGS